MRRLYQCEVCNALYDEAQHALTCEAHSPEPKYKVGDAVWFPTRYDGEHSDVIVARRLASGWNSNLTPAQCLSRPDIPLGTYHAWVYQLKSVWQWGKDTWSDEIAEDYAQSAPCAPEQADAGKDGQ